MRNMALCCALVLFGCAHLSGGEPVSDLDAYYPLALGNQWTYAANLLGEKRLQTVRIVRERDGYFEDSQGGQLTVDPYGIRDQRRYLLRGPLEKGNHWKNVVSVSSIELYRIREAGVPCTVPAGTFHGCVVVESENRVDARRILEASFTFAPHVGLVRIQTALRTSRGELPQSELELQSYHLQPAGPPSARSAPQAGMLTDRSADH